MARRGPRFGLLVLAAVIALALWSAAHGTSKIERGYDIPVIFNGISDKVVIVDQSHDAVNIQVRGSRAALRNIRVSEMEYAIEVSGGKPGLATYEVDVSHLVFPRGARTARIVSRSPSRIDVKFERRGRKSVRVRPDLEGDPAPGFMVASLEVEPDRVWLVGARSEVLRLSEVVTETVDVSGLAGPEEREVRLSLGGGHVWMEDNSPVTLRIAIEPMPEAEGEAGTGPG
jgi:YbbR domain-containing protein